MHGISYLPDMVDGADKMRYNTSVPDLRSRKESETTVGKPCE